jgi:hypothetical protein
MQDNPKHTMTIKNGKPHGKWTLVANQKVWNKCHYVNGTLYGYEIYSPIANTIFNENDEIYYAK